MQKDSDLGLCVAGNCPNGEVKLASDAVGGGGGLKYQKTKPL